MKQKWSGCGFLEDFIEVSSFEYVEGVFEEKECISGEYQKEDDMQSQVVVAGTGMQLN